MGQESEHGHPRGGRPARPGWLERLEEVALQDPLIETRPSLEAIRAAGRQLPPGAVFVGVGLCARSRISAALPLDVLGVVLPAERVRRATGASSLVVMVADSHALSNGLDEQLVDDHARTTQQTLELIRARFELPRMEIVRASRMHATADYQAVLSEVDRRALPADHDYFKLEVADVEYLDRTLGGIVKVGWSISPSGRLGRRQDEIAFDWRFGQWMKRGICFVYCKAGRALDDRYPKASPYVTVNPPRRVCLRQDEEVRSKLERGRELAAPSAVNGVRKHLKRLTRAYSQLVGPLEGTLEQRVQSIISRAFSGTGDAAPIR